MNPDKSDMILQTFNPSPQLSLLIRANASFSFLMNSTVYTSPLLKMMEEQSEAIRQLAEISMRWQPVFNAASFSHFPSNDRIFVKYFQSLPLDTRNRVVSRVMKDIRLDNGSAGTMPSPALVRMFREFLPPLNLNAQSIVTFISILIGILGILIPLATSKEDEILQNQRELIHLEEQHLEALREIQKSKAPSPEKSAHTMPGQQYRLQNNEGNEKAF